MSLRLWIDRLFVILLPVVIVLGMVEGAKYLMSMKKPPKTVKRAVVVPKVKTMLSTAMTYRVEIQVEGTVTPMWEATMAAQVAGQVLSVSDDFQAGMRVKKGEVLVTLERVEYEVAVAQAEAAVVQARQLLAEEEAKGARALREWTRSGRKIENARELSLRKPQLEGARANVRSAEAGVERARLNMSRTTITAPFDGVIEERMVSPGDVCAPGKMLGRMLGSERFQVKLSVSPARAEELDLGRLKTGTIPVMLTSGVVKGKSWPAEITRIDSRLDTRNRFVNLIAEIPDPLGDPENRLLAGAFVEAWIDGNRVSGAHAFPTAAIVRDSFVWTVDENSKLKKAELERVFSKEDWSVVRFKTEPLVTREVLENPVPSYRNGIPVEGYQDEGEVQSK